MTVKDEATKEAFRNINALFDPWMKAMQSWISESEKFNQSTIDGLTRAIDNSHRLAKEGLEMATQMGTTIQKYISGQIERTINLTHSFMQ